MLKQETIQAEADKKTLQEDIMDKKTLILKDGSRVDLTIDENGDQTLTPWEGGESLALHSTEGDQDRIDEIVLESQED